MVSCISSVISEEDEPKFRNVRAFSKHYKFIREFIGKFTIVFRKYIIMMFQMVGSRHIRHYAHPLFDLGVYPRVDTL